MMKWESLYLRSVSYSKTRKASWRCGSRARSERPGAASFLGQWISPRRRHSLRAVEDMEESRCRTVSARVASCALLLVFALTNACSGRYARPRTLASLGGLAVGAGSLAWATGQGLERNGHATDPLVTTGFVAVAVGLAAVVAAGGWMAVSVACTARSSSWT